MYAYVPPHWSRDLVLNLPRPLTNQDERRHDEHTKRRPPAGQHRTNRRGGERLWMREATCDNLHRLSQTLFIGEQPSKRHVCTGTLALFALDKPREGGALVREEGGDEKRVGSGGEVASSVIAIGRRWRRSGSGRLAVSMSAAATTLVASSLTSAPLPLAHHLDLRRRFGKVMLHAARLPRPPHPWLHLLLLRALVQHNHTTAAARGGVCLSPYRL